MPGPPQDLAAECGPGRIDDVDLVMDMNLDDLHLRTLVERDAALLVEATREESARALWGARPAGPHSLHDAQSALRAWDPQDGRQVSYGALRGSRLVAAVGLMLDGPQSAELAYWVRPDERRRGIAGRSVAAVTGWAHQNAGLTRIWLEINPDNTASLRVAERAGYHLEQRMPQHCRSWIDEDPQHDTWHDCLIWVHTP
jgi:RimJ/RimL family protein N-acetyltransferase